MITRVSRQQKEECDEERKRKKRGQMKYMRNRLEDGRGKNYESGQ